MKEFILFWANPTPDIIETESKLNALRVAIESISLDVDSRAINVTASFGYTHIHWGDSVLNAIKRADMALYTVKQLGRNCVLAQIKFKYSNL
ncbi:diguanylate cyclase [Vibrio sp. PP-XX7]